MTAQTKPLDLSQYEGDVDDGVFALLAECKRQREEIAFIERFADAPDVTTGKTTRDEQREQIAKLREALERIKSIVQHEPLGKLGNALTEIARAALKATA